MTLSLPAQDEASSDSDEALARELADALNEMAEAHRAGLQQAQPAPAANPAPATASTDPGPAVPAAQPQTDRTTIETTHANAPAHGLERP